MKKILSRIGNTLCVLIIIVLVVFELLKISNYIYIVQVQTGLLESGINSGDYVLIKKSNTYKTGDIITFKINDYYVTQEITNINGNKILSKGDINNTYDDAIYKKDVVGKVVYKGSILNFLIEYRTLLIFTTIILFVVSWFLESISEKEEEIEIEEVSEEDIKEEIKNSIIKIDDNDKKKLEHAAKNISGLNNDDNSMPEIIGTLEDKKEIIDDEII